MNGIKMINGKKCLELRATRIDKLNDPTEMKIDKACFLEILTDYEEKNGIVRSGSISEYVESITDSAFRRICETEKIEHAPYIACFSKEEDFMPMWSLYGDKGHGVCLCFTEGVCCDLIKQHDEIVFFYDVSYDKHTESDCVSGVLESGYKCDDKKEEIIRDMYLGVSPFIKNNAYRYESEYRVCAYNFCAGDSETYYDCVNDHISLYVPLNALQKVVLGTKLSKEITEKIIALYFEKEKYDIMIERSKIPFR